MKVTAFVGSARKKHTYHAAERFLAGLNSFGNIESEIVQLSDYSLGVCIGCKLCTDKGEEFCPLKDDRDILIEKMIHSDGIIFASPNYFFHVSGLMKIFLDRLAFLGHRPRFFGKAFTCIVAQGIFGGGNIVKYLSFLGDGMGFNVVKGRYFNSLEPMTEKGQNRINRIIDKQSKKFYKTLAEKKLPTPSLFKLMIFRWGRTAQRLMLDESYRDFTYAKENGLFESDYYYPVRLGLFKKLAGRFFDWLGVLTTARR